MCPSFFDAQRSEVIIQVMAVTLQLEVHRADVKAYPFPTNKKTVSARRLDCSTEHQKSHVAFHEKRLPFHWRITNNSISLSIVILCFGSEYFKSAFITVGSDDFQIPVLCESGQYNSSFESGDCRPVTILMRNIPLSQNVNRNSCCINTFSVLEHILEVIARNVSLCHSKGSVFGKVES